MKVESWLFIGGAVVFVPLGLIYGWLTKWHEPVGIVGILLVGGLSAMIGAYLFVTARRLDPRPEDNPFARVSDHEGEQGFFSPWSWWPLAVAASGALVFLGVAVGWWVSIIGVGIGALSLVGWVYEYYRGAHAH